MGVAEAIALRKQNAQNTAVSEVRNEKEKPAPFNVINVGGRTVKIPTASLDEFFERTGHNNLGELTASDLDIIENMKLGITIGQYEDVETLKNAQNAIGSGIEELKAKASILEEKKIIDEQLAQQEPGEEYSVSDYMYGAGEGIPSPSSSVPEEDDYSMYAEYDDADDFVAPQIGEVITGPKDGYAPIAESQPMIVNKHKYEFTDLGNIKIAQFSPKKLVKQRRHTLTHGVKTPVVALSSNIYGEMAGFTSADLVTMTNSSQDRYLDLRAKYQLVFNKLINCNVKLTFDTFLRGVSMFDQDAFFFGGFKSTYGDKINIPLTCTSPECKHAFTVTTSTDDVILSKDYVQMGDKAMEIMAMTSYDEILNDSDVNKIQRKMISSYHVIDIDHPSLHTYLEKVVKMISNNDTFQDEKYSSVLDLLPFIHSMYVPMFDGDLNDIEPADIEYMEVKVIENDKVANNKMKLLAMADELLTLTTAQLFELTAAINDRVDKIKNRFEIGLTGVECPKCKTKPSGNGVVPFQITDLLFLVSLQQAKELNMKKNTTEL